MPFGLLNAPTTFQWLINKVVAGFEGCADTWEEHVHRIRALFDCLAWANLTVNLAKCKFVQGTITYLGKVVGQGQVCPVRAKVLAIDQCPLPATKKELMCFLGMVGYYFCPNPSAVVAPLSNILSSKVKFEWSPQCQRASEDVKGLISSASVLAA